MEPKENLEAFIHNHYKDYCIEGTIKERVAELEEIIRIVWKVATDSTLDASRWRKVSEELPESYDNLLDSDIPDVECTRYVLVRTRDGHIYENRRLKMTIGNKEWVWAMSVEGDTDFTEWKPID